MHTRAAQSAEASFRAAARVEETAAEVAERDGAAVPEYYEFLQAQSLEGLW